MTKVLISQVFCLLVGLFSDISVKCTDTLTNNMFLVRGVNFVASFFQSLVRNHHKERCSTPYCHVSQSRSRFYTIPLTVAVKKTIYVLYDVISHTIM